MAIHEIGTHYSTSSCIELQGIKVLVVDDDPDLLYLMDKLLGNAKASVVTAGSADEAMRLLRTHEPHLIVSDISMPDCGGLQLIKMIRSRTRAEGGATPAIAISGLSGMSDKTRALLAGYQVHLSKPIVFTDLIVTIKSLVAQPQSVA
jgi:CheY-like chemotaxis protein